MVRLEDLAGDRRVRAALQARYGIPPEALEGGGEVPEQGTAMIKDETYCTRCGLCAERCPTGAITMEAIQFQEQLVHEDDDESAKQVAK